MNKKEVMNLIKWNMKLLENQKIFDITKIYHDFHSDFEYKFPKIEGVESQILELKKEFTSAKRQVKLLKRKIDTIPCNHPVRLYYPGDLSSHSECVFCQKYITDDYSTFANTIYNSVNRNRNCVQFTGKYDCEYFGIKKSKITMYQLQDVYEILLEILKDKKDEEEIDFISEIKKLNLEDCFIDERLYQDEYYILIIGGSNQLKVGKDSFITSHSSTSSIDFAYYLFGIPHVNVELFDNEEKFQSQQFKKRFSHTNVSGFRYLKYDSLEELKKIIEKERDVPFDIVIDISSLYDYKFEQSKIVDRKIDLDLKNIFKDSNIIHIQNLDIEDQKDILNSLQKDLLKYDVSYCYLSEKYYYLNQDKVENNGLEETCEHIKKLMMERKHNGFNFK